MQEKDFAPILIAFMNANLIEKKREILQTHQDLLLSDRAIENLSRLTAFFQRQGNITMAISGESHLAFLEDARRHGNNVACDNFEKQQAIAKQIAELTKFVNTYFSFAQSPNAKDKQIPLIRQYKELCLADANLELLRSSLAQAQVTHQISTAAELQRLYKRFAAIRYLAVEVARLDAFGDVVEAKNWQDLQSILEKALIYVASDERLAWQRNHINTLRASGKTKEAEESEGYFQLFYDARFLGIQEACKRFKMRHDHDMVRRLDINDAVPALLNAPDASAAYQILAENEELLRSDLALACIQANIEEYRKRDEPDEIKYLEQYLHLVEDLKEYGLTVAWQNFQHIPQHSKGSSYVYRLMREYIDLPNIPENMPQKIELLNLILKSPEGEQTPGLKAMNLAERAACYLETRDGERAENTEQAIKDIVAAIELYPHVGALFTRQKYSELLPNDRPVLYQRLGTAYRQRIYGNAADNIEQALDHFQTALDLCDQETEEFIKAGILIDRGNAYKNRIRGERAENIELAIQDYLAGLKKLNREEEEHEYHEATVHLNLGSAYRQRLLGVRAYNVEQAIEHYDAALEGFTCETTPIDWAMTLIGRGNAYLDRTHGNPRINNDNALADFDDALEVLTSEHTPYDWAVAHMNRGNAYAERAYGDRTKNLQQAIEDFKAALTILTPEKTPNDWAEVLMDRGNAFLVAVEGGEKVTSSDKTAYLEKAIADFDAALTIRTLDIFPYDWAKVRLNRGVVYSQLPTGAKSTNLQLALLDFDAALEIYTLKATPRLYRITQINRASVLEKLGRWKEAHKVYIAVREAIQLLLETATSDEERAEILHEKPNRGLYLKDVQVLLRCDPLGLQEVVCVLEEGRAQNLRAALDQDTVNTYHATSPQAQGRIQTFLAVRDALRQAQRVAVTPLPTNLATLEERRAEIAQRRRRLDDVYAEFTRIRELIRILDNPAFLAPASDFASIAQAVPSTETALVYLVPGETISWAFIITRDYHGEPQTCHIPLPLLKRQTLDNLLITETTITIIGTSGITPKRLFTGGWLVGQRQIAFQYFQEWGLSFDIACSSLPEGSSFKTAALHLRTAWLQDPKLRKLLDQPFTVLDADEQAYLEFSFNRVMLSLELEKILSMLGKLGMSELAGYLQGQKIQKVTLIPHGLLSLFPLSNCLIRLSEERRYLSDIFEVTLAPNAQSVKIAHGRAMQLSHEERPVVLTVGNPLPLPYGRGNLPFAKTEAETVQHIAQAFYPRAKSHSLLTTEATKEAVVQELEQAWYAHMAVHGNYRDDEPRRSRLVLAGDERVPEEKRSIYLSEVLDGSVNLRGLRLLVLSACETALIDIEQLDEAIGLATGFLQAGASGIIASLWAVNDRATYFLMSRFAQLYLDPRRNKSPAWALAEAQRWLRELATNRLLETYDPTQPEPWVSASIPAHTHMQENSFVVDTSENVGPTLRSLHYNHNNGLAKIHDRAERQSLKAPDAFPYADPIYWAAFVVTGY